MLESLRTTRGRVGIALLMSLAIAVFAVLFSLPIAIVPALFVPVWVSVFASREPAAPPGVRMMLVFSAGGLAILTGVGILIFLLRSG